MSGIEGAGGTESLCRLLVEAAQSIRGTWERFPDEESTASKAGMESALSLSRKHLSAALEGTGFVDIHAGSIARMEAFVNNANAGPDEVEAALDPKTASEIATYMGSEITGDVDQVLRILARVHPERVATLLK